MKKLKKTIILLLGLAVLGLTACGTGGTVNTTLNIESDFSGNRQMQVVISQSTFGDYFTGTQDDLNNVITENCPADLTWTAEADGEEENLIYTFNLAFASSEEYVSKLTDILGEEPAVEINCPDSVWVSGVYVNESFTSNELLAWLPEAVVSAGFVDEEYKDNILGYGDTRVVHAGKENSTSSQIYLDEVEYEEIRAINILTDVTKLGKYNRTVDFLVPQESMDHKGNAIRDYMNGITPMGCDCEESNEDGVTHFVITGRDLTAESLEYFMKSLFGEKFYSVKKEDAEEHFSPFVFNDSLEETVQLNNFVVGNLTTNVRYMVQDSEEYSAYLVHDPLYPEAPFCSADEYGYPGYSLLQEVYYYGSDGEGLVFPLLFQKEFNPSALSVKTSRGMGDSWKRDITISFREIPDELEAETIISKLESRTQPIDAEDETVEDSEELTEDAVEEIGESAEESIEELSEEESGETVDTEEPVDTADTETVEAGNGETDEDAETGNSVKYAKVKIKSNTDKDGNLWEITISQKGTVEEMKAGTDSLLDTESDLAYARGGHALSVVRPEAYYERLDFNRLLGNTEEDFDSHYELDLDPGALKRYCSYSTAKYEFTPGGGRMIVEDPGTCIDFDYVGSRVDFVSVLFWLMAAVTLGIGIWCIVALIIKNVKKQK